MTSAARWTRDGAACVDAIARVVNASTSARRAGRESAATLFDGSHPLQPDRAQGPSGYEVMSLRERPRVVSGQRDRGKSRTRFTNKGVIGGRSSFTEVRIVNDKATRSVIAHGGRDLGGSASDHIRRLRLDARPTGRSSGCSRDALCVSRWLP